MKTIQPIDEIRAIRQKISAEFGHDTKSLLKHYKKLEKKYANRILKKEFSFSRLVK